MKIKLTLERAGRPETDLVVTVDATATVSDVASALLRKDPLGLDPAWRKYKGPLALTVLGQAAIELDPVGSALEGGLHSGCRVRVSRPAPSAAKQTPAAILRVIEGPDQGSEFPLGSGSSLIGRTAGCQVRLKDTFVSREHARIHISEHADVVDLGSANGILVNDDQVPRATLRTGDRVRLGDTVFVVDVVQVSGRQGGSQDFNRSPRLDPSYAGQQFTVPEPPQRQQRQRFPFLPLMAPLLFGAIAYAITRSPTSLIFVALSPAMMLANAVESRTANRRAYRNALEQFRSDLAALVEELTEAAGQEVERRRAERPSVHECVQAVAQLTPLVWCRRPGSERFLDLRFGLGTLPSRNTVDLPDGRATSRELLTEIHTVVDAFEVVPSVPVATALDEGAIGVAGHRNDALPVLRSLVLQAVCLHSPAEVVVTAFASAQTSKDWTWLAWLPHTTAPQSPVPVRHLAANQSAGSALLNELRRVIDEREESSDAHLPSILVVAEDDAPVARNQLVDIAERGRAVGVHVLWLSSAVAALPSCCTTFVDVRPGAGEGDIGTVGMTGDGIALAPVALESASDDEAQSTARRLSPLIDSGALVDDESDLPRSVSWLALHDPELATSSARVLEQWSSSGSILTGSYALKPGARRPKGTLRAVIGQNAGEPHALDLRAQGPHALVGGTTGSGKSELLQSWILSMAAAHSPQRVNFLLVDYKGGSAFKDCVALPHTVGLVTDLSPHLVRRALTSLKAELQFRERFLARHRAKDLVDVEERGIPDSPPSLVLVVDEFAALVQEVPEFVDGVVDVAQRGRSLGLHLILATQRPAGVIKDNLRANTNLRLALRVADEGDSTDVLGSPQAAAFDPAIPGRAVSKTGPGRLAMFQAAYAGGWTSGEIPPPVVEVEELAFGVGNVWMLPAADEQPDVRSDGPTDIQRVVETVTSAATEAGLPEPRKPWLAELATTYELTKLPTRRRDDELVYGVRDDPEHQAQPTVSFLPDRDGNMAVYGTGGSGKSTLLRTLAVAAGVTVRGGPCQVYGLDFGARGLAMLEELPHVGSIISGTDHERVVRLLRWLRSEIDERSARYSAIRANSITQYRKLAQAPDEQRLLVLIDGIAAFRQAYEGTDRLRWLDLLTSIAGEGRQVGIHLVLASETRSGMWPALASTVQTRLILRMADADDYGLLGMPRDVLDSTSPAGRGLLGEDETQVAVLGGTASIVEQAAAMSKFAAATRRAGTADAEPVRSLPEVVPLTALPALTDDLPTIGVSDETLAPQAFTPRGSFLVTGPPGSGRSTALRTLATALQRAESQRSLYYIGNERSDLASQPLWRTAATDPDSIQSLVEKLTVDVKGRRSTSPRMGLFIEGFADFANGPVDMPLQALLKLALERDHLVVFEAESSQLMSSIGLFSYAKSSRAGLALQPEQAEGTTSFRTAFPRVRRGDFPVGRGLLIALGKAHIIQMALA